jgi:hypothetical protein
MTTEECFPNLKRFRIEWNGTDFVDSTDWIESDEEVGGLDILSAAIKPYHWGVFPSGVHSLSNNFGQVDWIPSSIHRPFQEVWPPDTINAIRREGVFVHNATVPVVVIANTFSTTKIEFAVNAAFLEDAQVTDTSLPIDSISFRDLLMSLFRIHENSFPEIAIWIVQHKGSTNYFRPEIVFERRADRDPVTSVQRKDKPNPTYWKDDGPKFGDRLTLKALDLTRLLGYRFAEIMKKDHGT